MTLTPVFREAFEYQFSRLDPLAAHVDPPAIAVYDTLMRKGPDGFPRPGIAKAWSDNGHTWDVHLREDARFHSGDPCDARAVVSALEALRWDMHSLPGGRQLWYWDPVDRVSVLDDRTLRIHLHYPHPALPSLLWGTHTAIHNERSRQRFGDDYGTLIADGTGSQRLVAWSPEVIETASVDGQHPGIQWLSIPDSQERLLSLIEGRVDAAHEVYPDDTASKLTVHRRRQPSSMYLTLDWRRTDLGFDQLAVRKAISLAINRQRLAEDVLDRRAVAAWGPLPQGLEFYDPSVDDEGTWDLPKARNILDDAGWTQATDSIRSRHGTRLAFECVVQDDESFRRVVQSVQRDLLAVGAEVTPIFIRPFADFYAACQAGPAAALNKWLWPDTVDALIGFCSTSTAPFPNWGHASVPSLDSAFDDYLRSISQEQRADAANRAQRAFADHLPYVPLLSPDETWAWQTYVAGYLPQGNDLYPRYEELEFTPR